MRPQELLLFLVASLGLSGCATSLSSQQAPLRWTAGFWFWYGSAAGPPPSHAAVDVLFIHVGTIRRETIGMVAPRTGDRPARWFAYGQLPDRLPAAREYWAVFRYEGHGIPDTQAVPILAQTVSELREAAEDRHLKVAGVQLDIDCPTESLAQYAGFVHEVKQRLPEG